MRKASLTSLYREGRSGEWASWGGVKRVRVVGLSLTWGPGEDGGSVSSSCAFSFFSANVVPGMMPLESIEGGGYVSFGWVAMPEMQWRQSRISLGVGSASIQE